MLLQTYRSSPSKETAGVLGEQLQVRFITCLLYGGKFNIVVYAMILIYCVGVLEQYLVSKLVGCCIPLVSDSDLSGTKSSQVLSLLNQLTVDSDPSLHGYIKVCLCCSPAANESLLILFVLVNVIVSHSFIAISVVSLLH